MRSVIEQDRDCAKFRRIGQGCCGSVWAAEEGTTAMKREDGGPDRSLINDYRMHLIVLGAASFEKARLCVPRWPIFIRPDERWWSENLAMFPDGYAACNVLCSERIPPLPRHVRESLIDRYCPAALVTTIKTSDANRDCLVRLYLGRRKVQSAARRKPAFFSLRNYSLHLNPAEELELPILEYARVMAEALAMMHWNAKIDADDIEFVLGGVPEEAESAHNQYMHRTFGSHSLWVLDFDCCRPLTMDEAGIGQAARAFLRNDPYFPRPVKDGQWSDQHLWTEFKTRYLEYSRSLVTCQATELLGLPEKFVAQVTEILGQGMPRKPLTLVNHSSHQ